MNTEVKESPGQGRPSLEEITGEETKPIKVLITKSMLEYIDARPGFSRAGFIRYLIFFSMRFRELVESGEYDINEFPAGMVAQESDKWNRAAEEIFGIEIADEE